VAILPVKPITYFPGQLLTVSPYMLWKGLWYSFYCQFCESVNRLGKIKIREQQDHIGEQ
jgi:predicted glycosyltransferase